MARREDVRFPSADGTDLEGHLLRPDGTVRGAAVVCHPHPQFGGSMDNWMLPVLQEALAAAGWTALRFNFRGVELSDGSFTGGPGEVDDVLGAIDHVVDEAPGQVVPVFVCGWSFGALTALAAALRDDRVVGWGGVAPPVGVLGAGRFELPALDRGALAGWGRPTLWIIGERDQFTSVDEVRELAGAAGEQASVEVLKGDHFLIGRGHDLGRLVVEHAGRCLEA